MLFLFGWPPCQWSDMILMEVSQHAYDMIHYVSGLFGYFSVCEIYVNLIWYLYLFMLNKFCLSLSLSLSLEWIHSMNGVRSIVSQSETAILEVRKSKWCIVMQIYVFFCISLQYLLFG